MALLAYTRVLDTYVKSDRTFLKFQDTLADLMEGLKDKVNLNHVEGGDAQADLRLYDFAQSVLRRRLDQKGVTIRTKEIVADILAAKMEVYLEIRDARAAANARDAAVAIYREIQRTAPHTAALEQKIDDLQARYRELQRKFQRR